MFIVDAAVLLPHAPHTVARVVGRLYTLPRWCAGLRRVCRFAHVGLPGPPPGSIQSTPTLAPAGRPGGSSPTAPPTCASPSGPTRGRALPGEAAGAVEHVAAGDGLSLTWAFSVTPESVTPEA
jgi:hypothetical protein